MTAKFERMFAIVTDDPNAKEGDEILVTLANSTKTKKVKLGPFLDEDVFHRRVFAPARPGKDQS
jgi:hypothetical protein